MKNNRKMQMYSIPSSRILPPNLEFFKNAIFRDSLSSKCFDNKTNKIFLVSGGAGTGKTTLLSQITHKMSETVIWMNLAQEDTDLRSFAFLLLTALQKRCPGSAETLDRFLESDSFVDPSPRVLATLFAVATEEIPPFVLVMDNYHYVSDSNPVAEMIENLVEIIPDHGRLMLASRHGFDFKKISRWRVNQWLGEITETDLLFTPHDVTRLMKKLNINEMSAGTETVLCQITQGRAGLLALLISQLVSAPDPDEFFRSLKTKSNKTTIIEYITREILYDLPDEDRNFVIRTSIIDRLVPSDINRLFGFPDASAALDRLVRGNWLTTRYSTDILEYRYHDLFRESAYQILREQFGCDALTGEHRRIAAYFEKNKRFLEAVEHFFSAGDTQKAVQILNTMLADNPAVYERNRLTAIIRNVPNTYLMSFPELLLLKAGIAFHDNSLDEALNLLDTAITGFEKMGQAARAVDAGWIKVSYMRFTLRKSDLEETCRNVLRIAGDMMTTSRLYIEMLQCRLFGEVTHFDELKRLIEQAIELAVAENDHIRIASEYLNLATMYYMTMGHFDKAAELYQQQLPVFEKFGRIEQVISCQYHLGIAQYHTGEVDRALQTFASVMRTGEHYGIEIYQVPVLSFLSVIHSEKHEWQDSEKYLEKLETRLKETPHAYSYNNLLFARQIYYAEKGDQESALEHVRRYCAVAGQTGSNSVIAQALTNRGEILTGFKCWAEAETSLREAMQYFQKLGRIHGMAYCHHLLAVRSLYENHPESIKNLKTALSMARQNGFHTMFLSKKRGVLLLMRAIEESIESTYASGLLGRVKQTNILVSHMKNASQAVQKAILHTLDIQDTLSEGVREIQWLAKHGKTRIRTLARNLLKERAVLKVEPLKIQCFQKFLVWTGNSETPVPDTAWRVTRAKSIFKYLLINRRTPIHKEVLVDVFWPESTLNSGMSKLYNALGHIRNALRSQSINRNNNSYVVCHDQHYTLILPEGSEVDYDLLDNLMQQSKIAMSNGDLFLAEKLFQKASTVFKGEFLPEDLYEDFTVSVRNGLNIRFIDWGHQLATKLLNGGFNQNAQNIAEDILNRDPANEGAVTILMKALYEKGQRSLLLETFRQYQEYLRTNLDTEPGSYLFRLCDQLVR